MCVSVFLYGPVKVEALRRADPPSKKSYEMSKWIHNFIIDSKLLEQAIRLGH
jgi:hypothetical protein